VAAGAPPLASGVAGIPASLIGLGATALSACRRDCVQGADTPVPVPVPVPDLSGDGDGASVPDLSGGGDAPPSPGPSPICPESGTLPRPRPRFAEIGDQAASVVLEYPKGVEGFAQVWSHNSQITRRTGRLCPDTP
jgi:hypothetical protein